MPAGTRPSKAVINEAAERAIQASIDTKAKAKERAEIKKVAKISAGVARGTKPLKVMKAVKKTAMNEVADCDGGNHPEFAPFEVRPWDM